VKEQVWDYCTKCPRIYGPQPLVGNTGLCKVHAIDRNHKAYEKRVPGRRGRKRNLKRGEYVC